VQHLAQVAADQAEQGPVLSREQAAGAEVTVNAETGIATVPVPNAALLPHVFRELDDRGIELAEFTLRKPSLDEVFFALTGHGADEGKHGPAETGTDENGNRELQESSK